MKSYEANLYVTLKGAKILKEKKNQVQYFETNYLNLESMNSKQSKA